MSERLLQVTRVHTASGRERIKAVSFDITTLIDWLNASSYSKFLLNPIDRHDAGMILNMLKNDTSFAVAESDNAVLYLEYTSFNLLT